MFDLEECATDNASGELIEYQIETGGSGEITECVSDGANDLLDHIEELIGAGKLKPDDPKVKEHARQVIDDLEETSKHLETGVLTSPLIQLCKKQASQAIRLVSGLRVVTSRYEGLSLGIFKSTEQLSQETLPTLHFAESAYELLDSLCNLDDESNNGSKEDWIERLRSTATLLREGVFGETVELEPESQEKDNGDGFIINPADPTAYVPAIQILNEHCESLDIHTPKQLVARLNSEAKTVRKYRPRVNRLSVHLPDWMQYVNQQTADTEPSPEDIANRVEKIRSANELQGK